MRARVLSIRTAFTILVGVGIFSPVAHGQVMTSTNYRIFSDTLSTGGVYSTSSNFRLHDAVGEFGVSPPTSTSATFSVHSGFVTQGAQILTLTVSPGTIDFGRLSSATVSTAQITATVSTNSVTGFSASVLEDHDLQTSGGQIIQDVADGAVTAGAAEYGFRTSGAYGSLNSSDTALNSSGTTFAQSTGAVFEAQTGIILRAAIAGVTAGGDYRHTLTVRASANF